MIHINPLAHKFSINVNFCVIIIIMIGFKTTTKNDLNRNKYSVVNFGKN